MPSGAPPTSDVAASQNGLFMTNDGRVFFTTEDALVHGDTNDGLDVYEYVDGRPQLITPGTGETQGTAGFLAVENTPGLVGVSANGTDVYFSTYDTPGVPGPQRPLPQVLRRPRRRRLLRSRPAAPLRRRRRVPRRRQLGPVRSDD